MNKKQFDENYEPTKRQILNALINKQYEEKLKILKTFLDESKIEYDRQINNYDDLVKHLKKKLSGDVKKQVLGRINEINMAVDTVISQLSQGSTSAFSRFANKVYKLIKPITIGAAINTVVQLAPGGQAVQLGLMGSALLYSGIRYFMIKSKNKAAFKEDNLNKYLRNMELTFNDKNELVDTRFNNEIQNKIKEFLANRKITFNDTGYLSLRNVIYSLDFDTKLDLVCYIAGKNDQEKKEFLYNLKNSKKVKDLDKERNKLIDYSLKLGVVPAKAALVTFARLPFLAAAVNSLLAKSFVSGATNNKTLGNVTGLVSGGLTMVNGSNFLIGIENYLILTILVKLFNLLKNTLRKIKNNKEESGLIKQYMELEQSKYGELDAIESEKTMTSYQNEINNSAPEMMIEIVIEFLKSINVDVTNVPRDLDGLTNYLKSNNLNASQKRKVKNFLNELAYYNKHRNNHFIRNLEKILKATGAVAILGLAGLSIYDLIAGRDVVTGKTFFEQLYEDMYYKPGEFSVSKVIRNSYDAGEVLSDGAPVGYTKARVTQFRDDHIVDGQIGSVVKVGEDASGNPLYGCSIQELRYGKDSAEVLQPLVEEVSDNWPWRNGQALDIKSAIESGRLSFVRDKIGGFNSDSLEELETVTRDLAESNSGMVSENFYRTVQSYANTILKERGIDRANAREIGETAAVVTAAAGLYNERKKSRR